MSSNKIVNFYEKIPKRYLNQNKFKYDNYEKIKINLPCRGIFIAPSGGFKTNALLNFLRTVNGFDVIYIIGKQIQQPLYNYLKDVLGESLILSDDLKDLPPLQDFDPSVSTLVAFDDFVTEDNKTLKDISKLYIRGRHKGISVLFLSQSYYNCPSLIRKNSDLVFLLKLNTKGDLNRFLKEYELTDVKPEKIIEIYDKIKKDNPANFILFDVGNPNKDYRIRFNFDPLKLTE